MLSRGGDGMTISTAARESGAHLLGGQGETRPGIQNRRRTPRDRKQRFF